MGLLLGIFALLLVCFMVFAMALAEWADQDPLEFFQGWWRKRHTAMATLGKKTTSSVPSPPLIKTRTTKAKRPLAMAKKRKTK